MKIQQDLMGKGAEAKQNPVCFPPLPLTEQWCWKSHYLEDHRGQEWASFQRGSFLKCLQGKPAYLVMTLFSRVYFSHKGLHVEPWRECQKRASLPAKFQWIESPSQDSKKYHHIVSVGLWNAAIWVKAQAVYPLLGHLGPGVGLPKKAGPGERDR